MAAIMTAGASAAAVLGNEEEAVEAVDIAHQKCTSAHHTEAYTAMHAACNSLHTGESCCQVYFAHNPDDRITSLVALKGAVPPFRQSGEPESKLAKNSVAHKAAMNQLRIGNRDQSNVLTGMMLT